eukprot:TRINITY_DN12563_c0_g1_i1.p1 TRINITY_DN12563_c0_g1~~TRINITY_DN12563_c0_g1_i1.p1  ORF type:complete len:736 (-),score=121.57 TRINITY_DN12563_c0_g1_i1:147-2174(-)
MKDGLEIATDEADFSAGVPYIVEDTKRRSSIRASAAKLPHPQGQLRVSGRAHKIFGSPTHSKVVSGSSRPFVRQRKVLVSPHMHQSPARRQVVAQGQVRTRAPVSKTRALVPIRKVITSKPRAIGKPSPNRRVQVRAKVQRYPRKEQQQIKRRGPTVSLHETGNELVEEANPKTNIQQLKRKIIKHRVARRKKPNFIANTSPLKLALVQAAATTPAVEPCVDAASVASKAPEASVGVPEAASALTDGEAITILPLPGDPHLATKSENTQPAPVVRMTATVAVPKTAPVVRVISGAVVPTAPAVAAVPAATAVAAVPAAPGVPAVPAAPAVAAVPVAPAVPAAAVAPVPAAPVVATVLEPAAPAVATGTTSTSAPPPAVNDLLASYDAHKKGVQESVLALNHAEKWMTRVASVLQKHKNRPRLVLNTNSAEVDERLKESTKVLSKLVKSGLKFIKRADDDAIKLESHIQNIKDLRKEALNSTKVPSVASAETSKVPGAATDEAKRQAAAEMMRVAAPPLSIEAPPPSAVVPNQPSQELSLVSPSQEEPLSKTEEVAALVGKRIVHHGKSRGLSSFHQEALIDALNTEEAIASTDLQDAEAESAEGDDESNVEVSRQLDDDSGNEEEGEMWNLADLEETEMEDGAQEADVDDQAMEDQLYDYLAAAFLSEGAERELP